MLNKKIFFIFFILLCFNLIFAEEDILTAESTDLNFKMISGFEIIPSSQDYDVYFLDAILYWQPRTSFRQEIISINTIPRAEVSENIKYHIENPLLTGEFRLESNLRTTNDRKELKNKITFPLNIDNEFMLFLENQEIIDINNDIKELAQTFIKDEDDSFKIAVNIARWLNNNIKYNLSSINADASIKSSQVLKTKEGVCDELTALFISLMRANGFPAKFVSGISYTNVPSFSTQWQPHGWAEVYFPDQGWVPFDVTYGQYGYVDAGHIKLAESLDVDTTSLVFESKGYNYAVIMNTDEQLFGVTIKNIESSKEQKDIFVKIIIEEDLVGFGSENKITIKIKNLRDYYIADFLYLSDVQNLNSDHNIIDFTLLPFEEQEFELIIKVDKNLNDSFIYSFPIELTYKGEEFKNNFNSSTRGELFTFTKEEDILQKGLFFCNYKSSILSNEVLEIRCNGDMKGTYCLNEDCNSDGVFNLNFSEVGIKNFFITFESNNVKDNQLLTIIVKDEPVLSISKLNYSKIVDFEEDIILEVEISKDSISLAKKARLELQNLFVNQEWELTGETEILKIKIDPKKLTTKNKFKLNLFVNNTIYDSKELTILTESSFFQKLKLYINLIGVKLYRLFE